MAQMACFSKMTQMTKIAWFSKNIDFWGDLGCSFCIGRIMRAHWDTP